MKKKYSYLLLLFSFLLLANSSYAQLNSEKPLLENSQNIEGLSIYPNPVSNGKIYVSTRQNLTKEIDIFDVLGKKIISETIIGKELDISKLPAGVYILKIKENDISATRKLVVR